MDSNEVGKENYILKLYVTGMSQSSIRAIKNIREICLHYLKDRCDLEVIDIYQKPSQTGEEDLIAVPTLIKFAPAPKKKIIGDLSDTQKVLTALGITEII